MGINQPKKIIENRDFYFLLRELLSSNQGDVDLIAQRDLSPRLDETQALTRIYLLARRQHLPEGRLQDVAEGFARVLKETSDESQISRTQLSRAIQPSFLQPRKAANPLKQYEEKALNFLRRAPIGFVDEELTATRPGSIPQRWLDPKPLTQLWPREILESPAWNSIESPVPGVPDLPLEDTWVNLTLRELKTRSADPARALESEGWTELSFDRDWVGVSLRKALLAIQGLTVIVGLPGAGKSTLMKWIARYSVTEPECPFGIPIVISLRQYAKDKIHRPDLSLFEYFLLSRGIRDGSQIQRWRSVAAGLLDPPDDESDTPETFLWLLDGWDEVPPEMRDSLMREIQSIALYPSIITTRHSGEPLRLPAQQYYEIQGLKYGAALDFAYRWLVKTGKEEYYPAIETGLEASPDLRRIARSPFLLTLLCALATRPAEGTVGGLPHRRGGVLGETLKLVFAQHNDDPKHSLKFGRRDREDISRFAFWLLAEAPGAPRYVFDSQDYESATSKVGRFETLLVPSRLIARPSVDSTDFQFLHASFQEFLAAQGLLQKPDIIPRRGTLLLEPAWKEVARFLAEMVTPDTAAWRALWDEAKQALDNPDKFGIIASRVSLLLAAAREKDGGKCLVGLDLRDYMWKVMKRYAAQVPTPLLEAFVELDPTDLARRILDHRIRTGKNSLPVSWLQRISVFDLEMLFTDHEKYRKVLALPEVAAFCPDLPDWIFDTPPDSHDSRASKRLDDLQQAILSRDADAAKAIIFAIIEEDSEDVFFEAFQQISKLPQDERLKLLLAIATSESVDVLSRGKAVSSLMGLGDRDSRSQLMAFLATREMDDSAIFPILGNLDDCALDNRETKLVLDLLQRGLDPEVRCAAAELLAAVRARFVAANMIEAFKIENAEEVRLTILHSIEDIADDLVIENLWELRDGANLKNSAEWDAWFKAILSTLEKRRRRASAFGNVPAADNLSKSVREWASRALASEKDNAYSKLSRAVLKYPNVLGKRATRQLIAVAREKVLPEEMRAAAIQGLSQLEKEPQAVEFLSRFAKGRRQDATDLLKQLACDALGAISPAALSKLKSRPAQVAMARLAFRHNTLFMTRKSESGLTSNQTSAATGIMPKPKDNMIRILLLSANPSGTGTLKLDEENKEIIAKVRASEHRDLIQIVTAGAIRPDDLLQAMNEHEPHVVQFSGHGSENGEGILICDERGNAISIDGEALADLFDSTQKNVQVVVLNACYSKPQAEAIATVVPCVVGMSDSIGDRAARVFAASFYSALGFGKSVQVAFKQGLTRLKLEGMIVEGKAQSDVPVLITRSDVKASEIVPVRA
jgi:hypothetical protein